MMTFKRGNTSSLDPVWPIYSALDLTREGRRDSATYPSLQYSEVLWPMGEVRIW